MELMRVLDIFLNKIKKDYKEDVACVVVMGSYVYNDTHSRSDLDLYYVPKTERGYRLGKVCIVEGIGFDFWPISWERLERMASHEEKITSIITEGNLMYYGDEEDLKKFKALKEKAMDISDYRKFINKAEDKLHEIYKPYYQLIHANNISDVRLHAIEILMLITHSISLLNRMPVKRGRGKLKDEILAMPLVPESFSELFDIVFFEEDRDTIKTVYQQMIQNTTQLIQEEKSRVFEMLSVKDKVTGLYEELINCYNKILRANDINDYYTSLMVACELKFELVCAFEGTGVSVDQLPDIIGAFNPKDMKPFMTMVLKHQQELESILSVCDIEVCRFKNFEVMEKYFETL